MKIIYQLVGKLLHIYQEIENELFLLYIFTCERTNLSSTNDFLSFDNATLGGKLSLLKKLKIIEDSSDIVVLEYIKNERNFLVHSFFIDDNILSESKICEKKKLLKKLQSEAEIIKKALANLLKDIQKVN